MPDDLETRITEILIGKVAADRFPSTTMMDVLEPGLTGTQLRRYLQALLDKIDSDRFPSLDMIRRAQRLSRMAAQHR